MVRTSISGHRVARELNALIERRGKPGITVSSNGTEFTSNAILKWASKAQVKRHNIALGKPMQKWILRGLQRMYARRSSQ
jgi:putative transposase